MDNTIVPNPENLQSKGENSAPSSNPSSTKLDIKQAIGAELKEIQKGSEIPSQVIGTVEGLQNVQTTKEAALKVIYGGGPLVPQKVMSIKKEMKKSISPFSVLHKVTSLIGSSPEEANALVARARQEYQEYQKAA